MSVQHFMAEDLFGSLLGICLLPLFLWIPGYALGWMLDLLNFRRRTWAFRVTFSLPLGIAACPILTYLLGRFGSMVAVWSVYAALAVAFLLALRPLLRRPGLPDGSIVFGGIGLAWLGIALFSLVDLQWGERLYYQPNAFDYALRGAFTHAITATGIPPQNPTFLPPRPVTLRYHYFWAMMCSLVNQIAPRWISARQAEIAGTFWCGLGLIALLASSLRLFLVNQATELRRRVLTGIFFLCIMGLDIVPVLFLLFLHFRGKLDIVLDNVESWNEGVDGLLHAVLWQPHAVAALIAAFTGFLLLWHAPGASSRRAFVSCAVLGGASFASAAGMSIWVTLVFGVFLILWTAVCAWNRWRRETMALLLAGLSSLALAWPYLRELQGPGLAGGVAPIAGKHLLEFTVRRFSLAGLFVAPFWPGWREMHTWTELALVNLPLLPLNYFLEFGCFLLIARIKWHRYRASGQPPARHDLACAALLATSVFLCTFVRSSVIVLNDLGWRGFLPAQFVLLLWSVDIWIERDVPEFLPRRWKRLLMVFIALGAAGTVYDLGITRLYAVLTDRSLEWMAADSKLGARNYAAREAYQWIRAATPENAVIQFNPDVVRQETTVLLYADRRVVAADKSCGITFGGDPEACKNIVRRLEQLYSGGGQPVSIGVREICRSLPVDILVAKDTDQVWKDPESWVWTEKPLFANGYVRLFGCGGSASVPHTEPR